MSYKKLCMMLIISFLVMYSVMFLNVDDTDHIYLSITRSYMAILMVAPMAVMMILMMGKMYPNKKLNLSIVAVAIVAFIASFAGLRTQTPVGDIQYMKAMIPHHSSAIMTSRHADITDPEVKRLSLGIIESQEREIAEMKQIIARMKN
jgi:uncharacterized protein (DUF305 family)